MKKLITLGSGILLMFTVLTNFASAYFIPLPIPITLNCHIVGSCAVYVDDDADAATADGTIDHPFTNITEAVTYVKTQADFNSVYIAEGSYSPTDTGETFPWSFDDSDLLGIDAIYIYGSYKNDFSERDSEGYQTLIDLEGNPVALKVEKLNTVIEGLTITGAGAFTGTADGIISIYNTNLSTDYSSVIDNNEFVHNATTLQTPNLKIDLAGSNTASVYGNNFNTSTNSNSVLVSLNGDAEFYDNVLSDNTTSTTLFCSDGGNIYNNYFIGISANRIAYLNGGCTFVHNTIADTSITLSTSEYAAVVTDNDGNMVANNLITGTNGNATFHQFAGDSSTVEYNSLYNNEDDPDPLTNNNIQCDPLYPVSSPSEPSDLILGEGSQCIDSGKTISSVSEDYFGSSRPEDGDGDGSATYDPGAYEAPEMIIPIDLAITNVVASPDPFSPDGDGLNDTVTLSFDISDDADVRVNLQYDGDPTYLQLLPYTAKSAGTVTVDWDGTDSNGDTAPDGIYTFLIDVTNANGADDDSVTVELDIDGLPVPSAGQCGGYTDVLDTHPDCAAIEYMQSIGAMTGNPDGTFAPDDYLQRDQIAKISLETFGLFDNSEDYCDGENPFPDVTSSDWAYQYICRGLDLGMIYGYTGGADAGYYRPARDVNRVEFLALILRNVSDTMPDDSLGSYDDVEGGNWYSGYAKYSYDNELFDGNKLFPTQPTTRLEVARHIYELYQLGKI